MARRKGWSSSQRIKRYCRNRARQEFNIAWRKSHPIQKNSYVSSSLPSKSSSPFFYNTPDSNNTKNASRDKRNVKYKVIALVITSFVIGIILVGLGAYAYMMGKVGLDKTVEISNAYDIAKSKAIAKAVKEELKDEDK